MIKRLSLLSLSIASLMPSASSHSSSLKVPNLLHFDFRQSFNYFKKDAKWTKSVHDFSEMDKKYPLNFRPKLKTRKFENLKIAHFPT